MKLITRDELRRKIERGDEFKLVMTLSALAYCAKHIPNSCYFETITEALADLDPAEAIVVYCVDVHCGREHLGVRAPRASRLQPRAPLRRRYRRLGRGGLSTRERPARAARRSIARRTVTTTNDAAPEARTDEDLGRVGVMAKTIERLVVGAAVTVARRVIGALLVVTGAVWLGQGLDLIQGSSMTGSTFWAVVGGACVVAGLGLLSWPWRQAGGRR